VAGWWFSPDPPVSSTNKTDHYDITEIVLKVVLNTIKQTNSKTCCRGQPLFRLAAVLTCCTCLLVLLRHKAINIMSDFKGVFFSAHCKQILPTLAGQ
jgi:hypothetical protein